MKRPASRPKKLLAPPVVLFSPALNPKKVLLTPVVLLNPASRPKKLLLPPVVLLNPALNPKKLLLAPVVLFLPAVDPKKLLLAPVKEALDPASLPIKVLLLIDPTRISFTSVPPLLKDSIFVVSFHVKSALPVCVPVPLQYDTCPSAPVPVTGLVSAA